MRRFFELRLLFKLNYIYKRGNINVFIKNANYF